MSSMELDYYLWKNRILHKSFAKRTEIVSSTLSNIVNKKRSPLLLTAMKIHCETKGMVSLYELLIPEDREEIDRQFSFITKNTEYKCDTQMELDYYLWKNKISYTSFAKKTGTATNTIRDIVNKIRSPLLLTAIKIHYETKGLVPFYNLLVPEDREEIKKYSEITSKSIYNPDIQHDTENSRRNPGPENEDNAIRNRPH